ncbi:MAG: hypothetical protein WC859_02815 [Elusimicrobiota bacterium]
MAGQVKQILETLIEKRSRGDTRLREIIITKMILKGFDPKKFDQNSPDDPNTIAQICHLAEEFGMTF